MLSSNIGKVTNATKGEWSFILFVTYRISTDNPWLVYNNVEIQKLALQELCTPTEALYIDEALHVR